MRKLNNLLVCILILSSCASSRPPLLPEDELVLTRQYVGNFVEYKDIPQKWSYVNTMRIRTSTQTTQVLVVYGSKCEFKEGEQLYLKRDYTTREIWGDWEYNLENDNGTRYKICQFDFKDKILVQLW